MAGLNDGGRNGGSPTNGVGSWPATGPAGAAAEAIGADGGPQGPREAVLPPDRLLPALPARPAAVAAVRHRARIGHGRIPGGWSGRPGPAGTQGQHGGQSAVPRTARSVPLVDRDICIPPVTVCSPVWHSAATGFQLSDRPPAARLPKLSA
ncbi:hypothetical protein I553_8270 [Mycobacterium xenopi 4042]|uniref:Uncharacterized protein n=1 Tax=Mycobacterium xenopi 4042 TaxID=1299334 RepID=X8BKD9_MYCXE|nr:hypothetical protein I553_8270 [Mycobacterium xenopi 4042]